MKYNSRTAPRPLHSPYNYPDRIQVNENLVLQIKELSTRQKEIWGTEYKVSVELIYIHIYKLICIYYNIYTYTYTCVFSFTFCLGFSLVSTAGRDIFQSKNAASYRWRFRFFRLGYFLPLATRSNEIGLDVPAVLHANTIWVPSAIHWNVSNKPKEIILFGCYQLLFAICYWSHTLCIILSCSCCCKMNTKILNINECRKSSKSGVSFSHSAISQTLALSYQHFIDFFSSLHKPCCNPICNCRLQNQPLINKPHKKKMIACKTKKLNTIINDITCRKTILQMNSSPKEANLSHFQVVP